MAYFLFAGDMFVMAFMTSSSFGFRSARATRKSTRPRASRWRTSDDHG